MTSEEMKLFEREKREERNREDREPVKHRPICHQCGDIIEGKYYHYEYYDSKGRLHQEDYCKGECTIDFFEDFTKQGTRYTKDIQ